MLMNVVREAPGLSNGTSTNEYGNIRLGANAWPMIQILDFSGDGNVDIVVEVLSKKEIYWKAVGKLLESLFLMHPAKTEYF